MYDYFDLWSWDGTLDRIHEALYTRCREEASREASPTAAIIDSQSVKSVGKGGACIDPRGYDAGKKRHVLVDTQGLLMHAIVHSADIQDRDGGALLMASLFGAFPFLVKLYADGGYQGPNPEGDETHTGARRPRDRQAIGHDKGFVVLVKADRRTQPRLLALPQNCQKEAQPQALPTSLHHSLMVMMGGGVVMTGRGVMMFGGRVFRHLGALRSIGFVGSASPMLPQ